MAPALTETAPKSQIKLRKSSPATTNCPAPLPAGEGEIGHKLGNGNLTPEDFLDISVKKTGFSNHITLKDLQHAHKKGLFKDLTPNINLKFIRSIPQTSTTQTIDSRRTLAVLEQNTNNIKAHEKMNKPFPVNGTNGVKQQASDTNNFSNTKIKGGVESKDTTQKSFDNSVQKDKHPKLTDEPVNGESSETNMVACTGNEDTLISDIVDVNNEIKNIDVQESKTCSAQDIQRKQMTLERKTQHLLRRLRRIQGKQVESHIRHQLSSFVNYQNSNLQTVAKSINCISSEHKPDLFQTEDVKNLSTSALVSLVRQLQSVSARNKQVDPQNILDRIKTENDNNFEGILSIDKETCTESLRVAGHLGMNLEHLQQGIDSDATESSSGGESCDEDDFYYDLDPKVSPPPL